MIIKLAGINGDINIGVVTFDVMARIQIPLTNLNSFDIKRINDITFFGGEGNLFIGLRDVDQQVIRRIGDRPIAPNVVMVISDTTISERQSNIMDIAKKIRDDGSRIISVGLTDNVDEDLLRVISSNVLKDYISISDFHVLPDMARDVVGIACAPSTIPQPTVGKYITWMTLSSWRRTFNALCKDCPWYLTAYVFTCFLYL